MKHELNHLQARQTGTQLQNATATVNGLGGLAEEQEAAEDVTDLDLFGRTLVRGGQRTSASTTH